VNDTTETTGRRALAATLDLVVAVCFAMVVLATTTAAAYTLALILWGPPQVDLLHGLDPGALIFVLFEFIAFSPFGWVSIGAGLVVAILSALARHGILALRSPGMIAAGVGLSREQG
jgi:hypothetical protein